eukprot:GHVT01082859.1.p1 GENE.GHVT01082859.1~~GHVT01082859.1.p1  ORF type:complete len:358 (+),score=37.22 GHVT01082859.1:635-1708(+)
METRATTAEADCQTLRRTVNELEQNLCKQAAQESDSVSGFREENAKLRTACEQLAGAVRTLAYDRDNALGFLEDLLGVCLNETRAVADAPWPELKMPQPNWTCSCSNGRNSGPQGKVGRRCCSGCGCTRTTPCSFHSSRMAKEAQVKELAELADGLRDDIGDATDELDLMVARVRFEVAKSAQLVKACTAEECSPFGLIRELQNSVADSNSFTSLRTAGRLLGCGSSSIGSSSRAAVVVCSRANRGGGGHARPSMPTPVMAGSFAIDAACSRHSGAPVGTAQAPSCAGGYCRCTHHDAGAPLSPALLGNIAWESERAQHAKLLNLLRCRTHQLVKLKRSVTRILGNDRSKPGTAIRS